MGTRVARVVAGIPRQATANARRVSSRVHVGVAASSFVGADSALYAWATQPGSPIDVVGFSFYPSYDGGGSLSARLRVADRMDARDDEESLGVLGRCLPGGAR